MLKKLLTLACSCVIVSCNIGSHTNPVFPTLPPGECYAEYECTEDEEIVKPEVKVEEDKPKEDVKQEENILVINPIEENKNPDVVNGLPIESVENYERPSLLLIHSTVW
jgi:hypothetical protein